MSDNPMRLEVECRDDGLEALLLGITPGELAARRKVAADARDARWSSLLGITGSDSPLVRDCPRDAACRRISGHAGHCAPRTPAPPLEATP